MRVVLNYDSGDVRDGGVRGWWAGLLERRMCLTLLYGAGVMPNP
jgi:hypothetical protein